jgi:phosphomannomutase
VLKHKKGCTVSNLSSTQALKDITEKHDCEYYFSAVGEVNVVNVMKESKAVIGGEGNGGIILPELHYGRDALAGIALFLSHLASSGLSMRRLKATYPEYHISKNKIELDDSVEIDELFKKIKYKYSQHPITTIDGIKIIFGKEWVHLRRSNTEPIIRIYAESDSETTAEHLARKMIADIKELLTTSISE